MLKLFCKVGLFESAYSQASPLIFYGFGNLEMMGHLEGEGG
jgi:hypothetical protein